MPLIKGGVGVENNIIFLTYTLVVSPVKIQ